ncbi:general stress protein [Roseomonas sp. GCM10028921]
MAMRTIARLYDNYSDAQAAVNALEAAGFMRDDISIVARDSNNTGGTDADTVADGDETATGAGTGATIGTVLGGGAGVLAGIGALAIPGLGPIVAAGWLVAALTGAGAGAAAGGLLGSLTGAGVEERDAHVYSEGVSRGGSLVTLRTDDARAAEAESIMMRHNPVDATTREADYRSSGWNGYQESSVLPHAGDAPEGTPANPPGTMLSRGVDQVAGTNVSGAHPENETSRGSSSGMGTAAGMGAGMAGMGMGAGMTGSSRDGTPGNPPGTMASRGADQVLGTDTSGSYPGNETGMGGDASRMRSTSDIGTGSMTGSPPDGTPGNPPGTKLSRGLDETLGTNISGAHPENEISQADSTTYPKSTATGSNPPGTEASRTFDRAAGTNVSGANPTRKTDV